MVVIRLAVVNKPPRRKVSTAARTRVASSTAHSAAVQRRKTSLPKMEP